MRIVFWEFVPHYGGGARTNVELARRLSPHAEVAIVDPYGSSEAHVAAVRKAGLDLHVLFSESRSSYIGGRDANPLVRALHVLGAVPNLLRLRRRTQALMTELRPSVVICNSFKAAMVLQSVRALREVPLVMYLQGWLPFTPQHMPGYGKRLCRSRRTSILAVSHATKGAIVCCGVEWSKVHVLPNGIDVDLMLKRADRPPEGPLPQAERAIRILLPAGIMRAKGQHTAVKAMRRLLDRGRDAVLWIAGDHLPIGANKHYLDETEALAQRLGVSDRVEWLGLRGDVPQLMRAATVVVLPSHTEGHPRVIVEAMALGVPVAATPVGGMLDLILPEVTGLFFEIEDDAGLAECVHRLADDPAQAQRIGRTAQQFVRAELSVERQVRRALQIFEKLTGAAGAGEVRT